MRSGRRESSGPTSGHRSSTTICSGPARYAGDYIVDGSETTLGLQIQDEIRAVVRFGPNTGFAVDPNGRLRLPSSEQGHFFLLDIDIFWQPTDDAFLSFAAENIIDTYRRLDEPSHLLLLSARLQITLVISFKWSTHEFSRSDSHPQRGGRTARAAARHRGHRDATAARRSPRDSGLSSAEPGIGAT